MNELVSVIILTWNRVELLKETVNSVLTQTYENLELLVIDNESTDKTQDYISGLNDKRVKYFKNPNSGILSVNRNYGIQQAEGRYIAFCDDDDLWLPEKLAKQMAFIEEKPRYKIVCTNGVYFDKKGDISRLIKRKSDVDLTLNDFLRVKNNVVLASVLIDTDVFSGVGLYNEDPAITNTEDIEFIVRAAAGRYPIHFINEGLVRYRMHDIMTSHANTLVTIDKEKLFFSNLFDKKVLSPQEYRIARIFLTKKYVLAFFKELLKRSKMIKSFVYMLRRIRSKMSVPDGVSSNEDRK